MHDCSPKNWFGVSGSGQGEWLEASLGGAYRLSRVRLSSGWDLVSPRVGDLFVANAHLRRVRLVFDNGDSRVREVRADERSVSFEDINVTTRSVRVVADEVWPGARWQDLCIAEVVIEGSARP